MATKVRAAHILVSSQLRAQQLIGRIRNGESFEALAKEYSACPSKANGGDLGYFERGQMVKPFEDAAFNGKAGEIVGPVKTDFGYHFIKIIDVQ